MNLSQIIDAMEIRAARSEDWGAIWPFFRQIVAAGETHAYDREMSEAAGRRTWMCPPPPVGRLARTC